MAFMKPAVTYVGRTLRRSYFCWVMNGTKFAYVLSIYVFLRQVLSVLLKSTDACKFVVEEAKMLTVIDYLVAFFWEFFSIIELLKEVRNWCGWILTCNHEIEIGCEVGGGVHCALCLCS